MKFFPTIIFLIFLLFFQIGILPHLAIYNTYPNLILLSVLSLSILGGWKKMLPWIILGGLFLDFYSSHNVLGISIIFLLLTAYLSYFLSQNIFKKTTVFSLGLIFLITVFIYNLFLIAFYEIFDVSFDFRFFSFLTGIIYNLIFALVTFYLIKSYVRHRKIQS